MIRLASAHTSGRLYDGNLDWIRTGNQEDLLPPTLFPPPRISRRLRKRHGCPLQRVHEGGSEEGGGDSGGKKGRWSREQNATEEAKSNDHQAGREGGNTCFQRPSTSLMREAVCTARLSACGLYMPGKALCGANPVETPIAPDQTVRSLRKVWCRGQARSSTGLQVLRECRVRQRLFLVPDRHDGNGLVPRPEAVRTQLRIG